MFVARAVAELAPGLSTLAVRTPTLPPATHTNVYMVGTEEFVLVEPASPYPEEAEQLEQVLCERLALGHRLLAILLTHHHADHTGGVEAVRQRFGAPVWAHAATAQRLRGKLAVDRELAHGERLSLCGPGALALECMHTPGHAPGHLCFLETRSGAMIAGDMVAGVGTILIEPRDGDMQAYLQSLAAMSARRPTRLLPAHGPVIEDPEARLAFYVQHRLAREAKVMAALTATSEVALDALLARVYVDTDRAAWPLARLSLEAHLVKLEREGRVVRGATGYRVASD